MSDKVTSVDGDRENCLYGRISLEFSNSWPGQVYLRFEPFGNEAAIMIRVMPGDIVSISNLADPYITDDESEAMKKRILHEIANMDPIKRGQILSTYRHPSSQQP